MWVLRIDCAPSCSNLPIAKEENSGHQADTEEQEDQPEEEEGGPWQCIFSTERMPPSPAFPSLSQWECEVHLGSFSEQCCMPQEVVSHMHSWENILSCNSLKTRNWMHTYIPPHSDSQNIVIRHWMKCTYARSFQLRGAGCAVCGPELLPLFKINDRVMKFVHPPIPMIN